ncbi:hypothetical protein BDR06DRAFT_634411 [Suillus hirtellus]|nr:hypothetical protein BDR06DRAFT_634411 [Suillus hirtellus]
MACNGWNTLAKVQIYKLLGVKWDSIYAYVGLSILGLVEGRQGCQWDDDRFSTCTTTIHNETHR